MKREWVEYLCDPIDKSDFKINSISKKSGDDIISGVLKSKSGNFYKIKDGVPILLTKETQSVESVESFEYEWEEFDFDYETLVLDLQELNQKGEKLYKRVQSEFEHLFEGITFELRTITQQKPYSEKTNRTHIIITETNGDEF